jgi:hypothetical protein
VTAGLLVLRLLTPLKKIMLSFLIFTPITWIYYHFMH